jgi:hypothetical protein
VIHHGSLFALENPQPEGGGLAPRESRIALMRLPGAAVS